MPDDIYAFYYLKKKEIKKAVKLKINEKINNIYLFTHLEQIHRLLLLLNLQGHLPIKKV